jgi:hypothetical protein
MNMGVKFVKNGNGRGRREDNREPSMSFSMVRYK